MGATEVKVPVYVTLTHPHFRLRPPGGSRPACSLLSCLLSGQTELFSFSPFLSLSVSVFLRACCVFLTLESGLESF